MVLYKVIWDEEYNGGSHDEVLTDPITKDAALNFVNEWAERRVLKAFPTISKEDELFDKMVAVKKEELSLQTIEVTGLYKVELKVDRILMNAFRNAADNLKDSANEALANNFGNAAYCKKEIQSAETLFAAMKRANENGLTKITLVFERED